MGSNCIITGILAATLAGVNIAQNVRCWRCNLCKNITVEKKSLVSSTLVNPEGDYDHNGGKQCSRNLWNCLIQNLQIQQVLLSYVVSSQSIIDYKKPMILPWVMPGSINDI